MRSESRIGVTDLKVGDTIVWGGAQNQQATVTEIGEPGRFHVEWVSAIRGNEGKTFDAWLAWSPGEDVNVWRGSE